MTLGKLLQCCGVLAALLTGPCLAADWSMQDLAFRYDIYRDQEYARIGGVSIEADVYRPSGEAVAPVLLYIHGGGWANNSREDVQLRILPWLQKGFAVVNIDYRKVDTAPAPAAVIDARCALNWVRQSANRFHFDMNRLVVSGNSSGGHLAMMAAYTSQTELFDRICWDGVGPKVAAVINWWGISDVADLIAGPNIHAYAVQWIDDADDPMALAKRVSPLSYIRPGIAPTLTVHGDADTVVPYSQSQRLHQALQSAGVVNELLTIKGRGHGDFNSEEVDLAYRHIWAFLRQQKVLP